MAEEPKQDEPMEPQAPRYPLRQVAVAVGVFYALLVLLDARGLNSWAHKLPVSERSTKLREITEQHWARTSELGLEEPKQSLETWFLDAQEAHPLLYPKTYAQTMAAREKKKEKKEKKEKKAGVSLAAKALPIAPIADLKHPSVLVIGDSIMTSVGPVIKKDVVAELNGSAEVKARVATGLARPDVFDWQRELKSTLTTGRRDFIVAMLGTNDSQDFTVKDQILAYGTSEWVRVYNERIASMMEIACRGAQHVFWFGLPPMQSASFERKATRINSWVRKQAAKYGCVEFVPLEHVLGDESGRFTGYLNLDGVVEKIRMVDGIHVTTRGGRLVSKRVLELIKQALPEE